METLVQGRIISPLASVGMAGENQIDAAGIQIAGHIFGMMAEKNLIPLLPLKVPQPVEIRLGLSGPDASVRFRVQKGEGLFVPPGLIGGETRGGQAPDAERGAAYGERNKAVVEDDGAGIGKQRQILLVQHPLVVAEGDKGGGKGRAGAEKLQRVPALVHFQPPGSGGRRSIQEIPGQKNQLRWMPAQAFQDRVHVLIVGVCQQRRGNRAGGNVIACLDHSEPPFDRVATVYHRNRTEARAGKLIGSSPFGDQRGTADFVPISAFSQRSEGRTGRKLQKSVQYAQKAGLIFSEYFFVTSCGFPPWGIK